MGPDTYFNLVVFSDRAHAWKDELVPATPANKGALRNSLQRLVANGSSSERTGADSLNSLTTTEYTKQKNR